MEETSTLEHPITRHELLEIKSAKDMSSYLETLQFSASGSISSALNAQLQVIKYVNSPDLTNSTFDLLFKNLDLSLKDARNEEEKMQMREVAQLMIHNFIFFANAKLEYSISKNKEAGQEILKDATRELLKSAVNVIKLGESNSITPLSLLQNNNKFSADSAVNPGVQTLAGVGKNLTAATVTTAAAYIYVGLVAADFIKKITDKGGIWDQASDFAFKYFKNKKDRNNFIVTVDGIVNKLDKYYLIIGKSNLMSDIIDRYSHNLIKLKTQQLSDKAKSRKKKYTPILILFTIFASIVTGILQLLNKGYEGVKSLMIEEATVTNTHYSYYWVLLVSTVFLSYLWILLPKFQLTRKINMFEQQYKTLSQKFLEI